MTHKISFVEKNANVPLKSVQYKMLAEYGCTSIHENEVKYQAMKDALADLRDKDDVMIVYSIAVIGRHWWPKVWLAVADVGAQGVYSLKTGELYSIGYHDAKQNYDACMEIEDALKARMAKVCKNNSGKPKSGVWKHAKQIQALVDDNFDIDELAATYNTSAATIRRIAKSELDVQEDKS